MPQMGPLQIQLGSATLGYAAVWLGATTWNSSSPRT